MQRDLLINLFTVFVISTITTEFPSMSETAPNVAVSSGYSRESNVCWMPASVAESSPGDGASVSRSEEHTSELRSRLHLACRPLLGKNKNRQCRGSCDHDDGGTQGKHGRCLGS